tara:strand:- start:521 stop:790 length:270 start_codon:yes stop_codon:yes gene_type:complete
MAWCCKCGIQNEDREAPDFYPEGDVYYYWDSPIEEDYDWRKHEPEIDCLCEICFDILNFENKIDWKDDYDPFDDDDGLIVSNDTISEIR